MLARRAFATTARLRATTFAGAGRDTAPASGNASKSGEFTRWDAADYEDMDPAAGAGPVGPAAPQGRAGGRRGPKAAFTFVEQRQAEKDAIGQGNQYRPAFTVPTSPAFYTGRAAFNDTMDSLERALAHARRVLQARQLVPVPEFARAQFKRTSSLWKPMKSMESVVGSRLRLKSYRRLCRTLNQLSECYKIAHEGDAPSLARATEAILRMFGRVEAPIDDGSGRGSGADLPFDELGRIYARGRRKNSSARVWVISTKTAPHPSRWTKLLEPELQEEYAKDTEIPTTTVLVNNRSLTEYFANPADRERVLRPLKLTNLIGAFNVFTLVRGGGYSGQSGAIAHGLAIALSAHVPQTDEILRKGTHFLVGCETSIDIHCQLCCSSATRVWSSGKRPVAQRPARGISGSSVRARHPGCGHSHQPVPYLLRIIQIGHSHTILANAIH